VIRLRSRVVVAVTLLAAVLAPGCGIDESKQGPPFHPGNIDEPRSLLVTSSDIEGIGASSPYGVVLAWWRALQREDVRGVQRSYAGRVSVGTARRQIRDFEPRFSQPVGPAEDESGKHATVDVVVRAAIRLGDLPNVIGVHDFPASFDLVRTGAGWRLRANAYGRYQRALLDALAEET
jgi:hypothetical protein